MKRCPRWLIRTLLIILGGPLCAGLSSAARADEPTPAPTPTTGSIMEGIETPRPKWTTPESRLLERIWWNQPDIVKALELKDNQRKSFDGKLVKALDEQRIAQQTQREQRVAMDDALTKGNWDVARKAGKQLADAVGVQTVGQNTLRVDVLSQLDEKQRQTLVTQYNYLLRRPWIVGVPMAGPIHMRGSTGGTGEPPQE